MGKEREQKKGLLSRVDSYIKRVYPVNDAEVDLLLDRMESPSKIPFRQNVAQDWFNLATKSASTFGFKPNKTGFPLTVILAGIKKYEQRNTSELVMPPLEELRVLCIAEMRQSIDMYDDPDLSSVFRIALHLGRASRLIKFSEELAK